MKNRRSLLLNILIGAACAALISTFVMITVTSSQGKTQIANQDIYDTFEREDILAYYSDFEQYDRKNPVPLSEINFNSEDIGWLYSYTVWFYETYPEYSGTRTYDDMWLYSLSQK